MHNLYLIDNYDSFTWNLVQSFLTAGVTPRVVRNDQATVRELLDAAPSHLVISPGPGTPDDAGISCDAVRAFAGKIPILGVCLGLQCIAQVFGARIVEAPEPVHGKCSTVVHDGLGIFSGVSIPADFMRYHSLAVDPATLPDCLTVSAHTADGVIMGLRHNAFCIESVQFHPESILSVHGDRLLRAFLNLSDGRWT